MVIKINEAIELIQSADAVIFDNDAVAYANLSKDEDCFMRVSWENGDGYYSAFEFYKSDNPVVDVEGSYMWLTSRVDGDSEEQDLMPLTLLFRQKLD